MKCEEFREKFVQGELDEFEKAQFDQHLKTCEGCRTFVQNYQKIKDSLKLLYNFKPSEKLRDNVIDDIRRRTMARKTLIFGLPGFAAAAVSVFFAFYIFSPVGKQSFAYDKAVSAGISMLKSNSGITLSSAQSANSNLDYLVKMKYVSDQF